MLIVAPSGTLILLSSWLVVQVQNSRLIHIIGSFFWISGPAQWSLAFYDLYKARSPKVHLYLNCLQSQIPFSIEITFGKELGARQTHTEGREVNIRALSRSRSAQGFSHCDSLATLLKANNLSLCVLNACVCMCANVSGYTCTYMCMMCMHMRYICEGQRSVLDTSSHQSPP